MTTIYDVAREARVAASTVSLVINNSDRVANQTRARVKKAIRELGYTRRKKPATARGLRVAFIYTLEAIVDEGVGTYCRELAAGIQAQAGRAGATVSVFRGAEHADADPIIDDLLAGKAFDGVILFGHEPRNGYLGRLMNASMPLVVFNDVPQQEQYSCVNVDFFKGTVQALEHLIALGHRRIARVHNPAYTKSLITQQRHDATRKTFERHGLEPLSIRLDPDAPSASDRIAAVCREMLDKGATAVHCSERLAADIANQLEQWKVRVPEDVSIIGFDNLGLCTGRDQPLTSIGYDRPYMGRLAVRMLKHMVRRKAGVQWRLSATVPTKLIQGQTTAPLSHGAADGDDRQ